MALSFGRIGAQILIRRIRRCSLFAATVASAIVFLWLGASAQAQQYIWNGKTDNTWANAQNWSPTSGPPGTGATALFNGAGNGMTTVDLGNGVTILNITFDTAASAAYTIGNSGIGAQTLTLQDAGTIMMTSTVGNSQVFNSNLVLGTGAGAGYTINNSSTTNTLTFNGTITSGSGATTAGTQTLIFSGAGNITVNGVIAAGGSATNLNLLMAGSGTLTLNGANTFLGQGAGTGFDIAAGTVKLGPSATLGAAGNQLIMAPATTLDLGGTTQTVGQTYGIGVQTGIEGTIQNGSLTYNAQFWVQTSGVSAATTLASTLTITNGANAASRVWVGGVAGNVLFNATNNTFYSGDTAYQGLIVGNSGGPGEFAGTILLGNPAGLGTAQNNVGFYSGTIDLNGQTNVLSNSIVMLGSYFGTSGALGAGGSILINNNTTTAASFGPISGTTNSGTTPPTQSGTVYLSNASNTLFIGGAGNLTLSGLVTNDVANTISGGFTKIGAGILTLSYNDGAGNSNNYSGGTVLSAGQININVGGSVGNPNSVPPIPPSSAIGSGPLTISAGTTIDNTSGSAVTLATNNAQFWNGNFTFVGSSSLSFGTGAVTLGANSTVTVGGNSLTVGGISGAFNLGLAGPGTLIVTGPSRYTGTTTVGAGSTLQLGTGTLGQDGSLVSSGITLSSASSALVYNLFGTSTFAGPISGSGSLTLSGTGTLVLSGANSYTGATTLAGGSLTVSSSGALAATTTAGLSIAANASFNNFSTSTPTLTVGSLNIGNNSIVGLNFGGGIVATGAATAAGSTITLSLAGPFTSGQTYTAISAASGNLASLTTVDIWNPTFTFTVGVTNTAVTITPTTAAPLATAYWLGGAVSSYPTVWAASTATMGSPGTTNWTSNGAGASTSLVPGANTNVIFSDSGASSANQIGMILGSNMAMNSLTFNSANPVSMAYAGFTLTLGSSATTAGITVSSSAGPVTLAENIALGVAQTWTNSSTSSTLGVGNVNNAGNTLTIAGTGSTAIGGVISGTGGLSVSTTASFTTGTGIVILAGANTYSGTTTINSNAVLYLNGGLSSIASSTVAVNGGALAGSGTTGPVLLNAGAIAPGNPYLPLIGTLNTGNLTIGAPLAPGASLLGFVLGSPGTSSLIAVNGALTLPTSGSPIGVELFTNGSAGSGIYTLATYTSLVGGNTIFNNTFTVVPGAGPTAYNGGIFYSFTNTGPANGSLQLAVSAGPALNPVYYADNFNRNGTLNGSAPTIQNGNTSTWSADPNILTATTGGGQAQMTSLSGLLPIATPVAGKIYTFTANATVTSGGPNWFAFGFGNSSVVTTTNGDQGGTLAWMLFRQTYTAGTYPPQYFYGGGTANGGSIPTTSPAITAAGSGTLGIVVDTRPGLATATVSWYYDGYLTATATGINTSTWSQLVISGYSGNTGYFQNLAYSTGSTWLAPAGTTGTGASWSNGTTTVATAASQVAGWSAGLVPNTAGVSATFGASIAMTATGVPSTANQTITLDANRTVGLLTFANSASTGAGGNYTIAPGTPTTSVLTLNNSGIGAVVTNYFGNNTISAPVSFADNVYFSIAAGTSLTLSGGITDTGAHGLVLNFGATSGGTLTLSGANTYLGPTIITAGTLAVPSAGKLTGTSSLTVGAGASFVDLSTSSTTLSVNSLTLGNNAFVELPFGSKIASSGAASVGTNAVTLFMTGNFTINTPYTILTAASGLLNGQYGIFAPSYAFTLNVTDTAITLTPTGPAPLPTAYWLGGLTNNPTLWAAGAVVSGTAETNWTTNGNGAPSAFVPGTATNIIFSDNGANPANQVGMTMGTNFSVNSLTFNSGNPVSLNNDGNTLTIGSTTGAGITVNSSANGVTLSPNIALGIAQTWTNNGNNTLTINGLSVGLAVGAVNNGGFNLTVAGAGNTLISGVISGSGGLNVSTTGNLTAGTGFLVLSGASTYTGPTTIGANAALYLAGGSIASSAVAINGGALAGSGATGAVTFNAGAIAPGNPLAPSIGTLTTGALTLTNAATSNLEFVMGNGGILGGIGTNSSIAVNGKLTLPTTGSPIVVDLVNNNNANNQGSFGTGVYTLATYTSLTGGNAVFNNTFTLAPPAGVNVFSYSFSNTGAGAGSLQLTVSTGAATNPVYYQDTFNRSSLFNGSAPTIQNGNTNTWNVGAAGNGIFTTSGTNTLNISPVNASALLPVAFATGGVYTLSTNVTVTSGGSNWFAMGFGNSTIAVNGTPNQGGTLAWMLFRNSSASAQFFYGGGTANGGNIPASSPMINLFGAGTLAMVVDTRSGVTSANIYWYINGYQVASQGGQNVSTWTQLAIGDDTAASTAQNLTYALGSYWLAPGGATGASASWNNANTTTAASTTAFAGWSAGAVPNAAGAGATFGASIGTTGSGATGPSIQTITLDGNKTLGQITFANSAFVAGSGSTPDIGDYRIALGTGGTLTLNNNNLGAVITSYYGNNTIAVPISLADNLFVNIAAGSSVTLSGPISDTGSHFLNLNYNFTNFTGGWGTLILANATVGYQGGTTVNNGVLQLGNGVAGGNATVTGGISLASTGAVLQLMPYGAASYSNVISGSGGVTMTGTGTATLTAVNTYSGPTTVNGGTLTIGATGSLPNTSGLTLAPAGGGTFNYVSTAAPTLSVPSLNFSSSAFNSIGLTYGDKITSTGPASAGPLTLSFTGSFNFGTQYTALTAQSGLLAGVYFGANLPYTFTLSVSDTLISVTPLAAVAPLTTAYWIGGLSGAANVWAVSNGTTTNWTTNGTGTLATRVPSAGTNVIFSDTGASAANQGNMMLGANMSVNSLTFNNSNPATLTSVGNTLTIGSTTGAGITVNSAAGAVTLSENLALGIAQTWTNNNSNSLTIGNVDTAGFLLTIGGSGSTVITGAVNGTGGLTVSTAAASSVSLGTSTTPTTNTYSGTTTVSSGSTLNVFGSIANSVVAIQGGTLNLTGTTGAVTITGGGALIGAGTTGALTLTSGSVTPGAVATPTIGTFTTAALSIGAGTTLNYVLGAPGASSLLAATGALTLATTGSPITVNLYNQGSAAPGTYVLATAPGVSGGFADFNQTFAIGQTAGITGGFYYFNTYSNPSTATTQLYLNITTAAASNPVFYQDTFNRSTAFGGSTPTTFNPGNTGVTGTWTAQSTFTTSTAGGGGATVATSQSALLPIAAPAAYNVYTFAINVSIVTTGGTNWSTLGMGTGAVDTSSPNQAGDLAWLLFRSASGGTQVFSGGGTANSAAIPSSNPAINLFGSGALAMVVDTRPGVATATVDFLLNGYQVASLPNINVSTWNQLIIGTSGVSSTYTNLAYVTGSYWLAPGGTAGANASWNNNNTTTATSASIISGWSAGWVPNNAGAQATFGASIGTVNSTITLDGTKAVGQLVFANSTSGGGNYTIAQGSGGTLIFDNAGAGASLTNYYGNSVISAPASLADNLSIAASTGTSVTFAGGIADTGTHSLTLNPGGTTGALILSGANTYLGGTVVTAGTLQLGTGINGADASMSASGGIKLVGASTVLNFIPFGATTYAGSISGAGSVTMSGTGTTGLTGANSYTGPTTVNSGILTLSGSGTLSGTSGLTVNTGGTFNYIGTAPTLTVPALTLSSNSTIGVLYGDTVNSSAAATVSGAVKLSFSGAFNFGTQYTALTAVSGLSGGTYFVVNPTYTYTLSASNTAVAITPTAAVTPLTSAYWIGGLTGDPAVWAVSNGSATNWTTNGTGTVATIPPSAGTNVFFSDASALAVNQVNMNLGANMAMNSITFNSVNPISLVNLGYTLTLGSAGSPGITVASSAGTVALNTNITLGEAQTWTNNSASNALTVGAVGGSLNNAGNLLTIGGAGNVTVASVVSGSGGLTMNGTGVVTLSNALNSFSGPITVSSGTLNVTGSVSSSLSVSGTLNLTSGVVGPAAINGGTLSISGSSVGAVTMAGGTLSGTGTTGAVTQTAAGLIEPGTSTTIGTLNTGAVTVLAGSTLDYVLGSAGNGSLLAAGALTLPTTGTPITVNLINNNNNGGLGSAGGGTFTLATYTSLTGGAALFNNTFSLGTLAGTTAAFYTFSNSGAGAGSLFLTIAASAPVNPVYYQDTFSRTTTFNGSTPSLPNGNATGKWNAAAGAFTTSPVGGGILTSVGVQTASALLPIAAFTAGNVYTISDYVTVTSPAGSSNWSALGFATTAATTGSPNQSGDVAWMLLREGAASPQAFYNGGTSSGAAISSSSPVSGLFGSGVMTIVVDTRSSLTSATIYYLLNGYQAATATGFNASTIGEALIGMSGVSGTFQNFTYATGSYWLAPGGATGTFASWTSNSTTSATATGQFAGWSAGAVPNSVGANATFGASIGTSNQTITLDGNKTVGQLTFANSTAGGGNYTINVGSGGALTMNNNGFGAVIASYYGSNTVSVPIALSDNLFIDVAAGAALTLSGGITDNAVHGLAVNYGAPALTGALTLSGANVYGGPTYVSNGSLTIAATGTLSGTSSLTIGGGATINNLSTVATTLTVPTLSLGQNSEVGLPFGNTIAATGAATVGGNSVLLNLSGAFTNGTPYTLLAAASGLGGGSYFVVNPTFAFSLGVSSTSVTITPTGTATLLTTAYWRGGLSGDPTIWAVSNGLASNWTVDGAGTGTPLTPTAGTNVIFSDASALATNQVNMTLGANMAINSLTFNNPNPVSLLGGNTLTIGSAANPGITLNSAAGPVTLNTNIVLGAAQSWTNNSGNTLTVAGSVNNGGNLLTVAGKGNTSITGAMTGAGGLTVSTTGNGVVTVSSVLNSYSGPTTISSGTLNVISTIASSATTIMGGILTGTGTTGAVTLTAGTIFPGSTTAIGTLTTGAVSIAAGSTLDFITGSPGNNSLLADGGALTLPTTGSPITVNLVSNNNNGGLGFLGIGTYTLATYASLSGGNSTFNNTFVIGTTPPGIIGPVYTFSNTGTGAGNLILTVTTPAIPINPVYMADTFNRATTFSTGSAPTIRNGNSGVWTAGSTAYATSTANGGQLVVGNLGATAASGPTVSAVFPIAAMQPNSVYTFSYYNVMSSTATNDWMAIGYANSSFATGSSINNGSVLAWMLERSNLSGFNPQMFYGGGTANGGNISATSPQFNANLTGTLSMVVATGATVNASDSSIYWLINGYVVGSASSRNVSTFAQVVIGDDAINAVVTSAIYAIGSYWLAPGGTTGAGASWNNNAVAVGTTPSQVAGWSGGVVPNSAGATATFGPSILTTNSTITLDGNQTVGQLTFANNTNAGGVYTIAQGSGGTLTFNNNGNGAAITNYFGNNVISAPMSFADNVYAIVANGTTLTLSGGISDTGAHNLTVNPTGTAGTLILTGANTFAGGVTISAGTLNFNSDNALGVAASPVNLIGGTLQFAAGGGITLNSARNIVLGSGAIDTNSGNDTISGVISGTDPVNSNLIKNGAGVLALTNINTYAGSTIVNAGGLVVGSTASLGSGPLLVNNTNPAPSSTDVYLYNTAGQTVGSLSGNLSGAASGNTAGIFLGAGVTLTVNQTTAGTFQGTIFGSGSLLLGSSSTSTLTLSGSSSYGGSTTINGGTLQLGVANALPATTALTLGSGGTLNLNSNDQTIAALTSSAGNINTGTGAGGILTVGNTAGGTVTYSGVISGAGGLTWGIVNTNVANPAPSTLLLTSASTNTGPMTINTGTLSIGTAYALSGGVAPVLPYNVANTYPGAFTLGPTATLLTNGFNLTVGSLGGGGPIGGNINLGNNSSSTLYIVQSSSTGYAGIISGTGNVYIVNGVNLAVYGNWTLTGGVTHDVTNLQGNQSPELAEELFAVCDRRKFGGDDAGHQFRRVHRP